MVRCGPYPAAGPRGPLDRVAQMADASIAARTERLGQPSAYSLRAFHHSMNIGSRIGLIDDLEVGENLPRRKLFDFLLVQAVETIKERPLVRRQFRMLFGARHGDSTCFG